MVSEAYQTEHDANLAESRLAIFGSNSPADIVAETIQYGPQAGFNETEMAGLEDLAAALRAWQPASGVSP